MTALRRVIEDEADAIAERVDRWDAMRKRWQADLSTLIEDDGATLVDISEVMKLIEDAEAALSIASAMEQAGIPDLDNTYPGRSAPGSY